MNKDLSLVHIDRPVAAKGDEAIVTIPLEVRVRLGSPAASDISPASGTSLHSASQIAPRQRIGANPHDSVKAVLEGGRGLRAYLAELGRLSRVEREVIVDQAIALLDGFY